MAKPSDTTLMAGGYTIESDRYDISKRRMPIKIMTHGLPLFWTPVGHMGETFSTLQRTECGDFELDWMRCASRVGYRRAAELGECSKYYDDYMECFTRTKTMGRYAAIQRQRKKQNVEPIKRPPHDVIRLESDVKL